MRWEPIAMPPSAAALFNKARAGHTGRGSAFSRTQEIVAGLYWFATLPLEIRLGVVHEFMSRPMRHDWLKADTTGEARFVPNPSRDEIAGSPGGG
jgi:hypothetical protein